MAERDQSTVHHAVHMGTMIAWGLLRAPYTIASLFIPEAIAAWMVMRIDRVGADDAADDADVCAVHQAMARIRQRALARARERTEGADHG